MGCSAGKEVQPKRQKAVLTKGSVLVTVQTAAIKTAGTDNDVLIRLIDVDGKESKSHKLDNTWVDDFKEGATEEFLLPDVGEGLGEIVCIEIWREGFLDDKLFLNVVFVKQWEQEKTAVFPVNRWIPKEHHLKIWKYDSFLPQNDPDPAERQQELKYNRDMYELSEKQPGLTAGCPTLPIAQDFTTDYGNGLDDTVRDLFKQSAIGLVKVWSWSTIGDMKKLYSSKVLPLPQAGAEDWYMRDDYFGEQRLSGCNPLQIKLCTAIPSKFAVTSDIEPSLEGKTLAEALEKKRLFLTDYAVLKELKTTKKELKMVAPLGLFYLTDAEQLLPVAIQLEQEPGDDNPVFLPSDPPHTWTMAKMWFNMADASVHQAKAHLGFTHLIAESICVVTHRQLSPSHPVFRLLAPHFLFLLAINHGGLPKLMSSGGMVDRGFNMGGVGMAEIIRRTLTTWKLDVEGTLPADIKDRDVGPDVLPHYPYRDDGMAVYNVIKDYVRAVIVGRYVSEEDLSGDPEIQAWVEEMVRPIAEGGAGLKGVHGGGKLTNTEDLIDLVTTTIFMCSAQHAAVNFCQYDQYGFPPVYPASLKGSAPISKAALTEKDIMDAFPSRFQAVEVMLISSMLSTRDTYSLGNFEVQYGYDDVAVKALTKFQEDLKKEQESFMVRNNKRKYPYTVMDPSNIPNAISI